MPRFRSLFRGERGRKEPESASRRSEARERPERDRAPEPGRDRERGGYDGEDFRYRPESGRHRYPEGLYSGIRRETEGHETGAREAGSRESVGHDSGPAPRGNGHDRRVPRFTDGRPFERSEFERREAAHPDDDHDADDRLLEEIEERTPRETREVGGLPSGPHRGRGPRGYRRSDERIREDVCDRLTEDPEIDASDIEVLVSEGEVTLNGSIETRLIRRLAEDVADTVSGVSLVQNNLRVGLPGSGTASEAPLATDPGLAGPGLAGKCQT